MYEKLPCEKFEWCTQEDIEYLTNHILEIPEDSDDSEVGYALKVDLEYPKELHDKHNDYPLNPEHMIISNDKLS